MSGTLFSRPSFAPFAFLAITLRGTGLALLAGACLGLLGCAGSKPTKIPRTQAIEPPKGWVAQEGLAIGNPLGLLPAGKVLYVSGTEGVAAIGAGGKILWQAKLPAHAFRQVDASSGLGRWLGLGDNADLQHFENAVCGTLGADGSVGWQKDLPATSVSAPAVNGDLFVFTTEKTVTVLNRKDGAPVSELETSQKGDYKTESNNMRLRPLTVGPGFAVVNNQWIVSIDAKGKETDRLRNKGDLDGLGRYGDAVLVGGGKVVTHYSGPVGYESSDWLVKPDGSIKKLRTRQTTPASDIATIEGRCYALTNFVLYADKASGDPLWKSVNDKGGMFPGPARGSRKLGSYDFFTRVSSGNFLSGGKGLVLVASHADRREPDDQIALLEAKTGNPMGHWTAKGTILDMTKIGEHLIVIDGRGVVMTELP